MVVNLWGKTHGLLDNSKTVLSNEDYSGSMSKLCQRVHNYKYFEQNGILFSR
jgi:hypothetical protein